MLIIGHAVLFFLAGFAQFNFAQNKGGFSAIIFLAVVIGGVYFLGWWALLTFLVGAIVGGKLAVEQRKKDFAKMERILSEVDRGSR